MSENHLSEVPPENDPPPAGFGEPQAAADDDAPFGDDPTDATGFDPDDFDNFGGPDPEAAAEGVADDESDDEAEDYSGLARSGTTADDYVKNAPPVTPEPELWPMGSLEGDPKTTLLNLIKPNLETTLVVKLSAAQVPSKDGQLLDPNEVVRLSLVGRPGKVVLQPQFDGDEDKITGWKKVQHVHVTYVESAEGRLTEERRAGRDEGRRELLEQLGMTEKDVLAHAA